MKVKATPYLIAIIAGLCSFSSALAQGGMTKPTVATPVAVEQRSAAPQVVTVLHRLNGFKMLRLLLRSGQAVGAVETMDDALTINRQVHTNIIAGLALEDGQTVAAWLPEAEVEVESLASFPMRSGEAFSSSFSGNASTDAFGGAFAAAPDLTIIARDGRRHRARYIGLDGITGLSLLKISDVSLSPATNFTEDQLSLGQRVHLFSPEPAPGADATANTAIYVRVGETEGNVVSIARGPLGAIGRIRIKSPKLSPANIGGIAVNDSGQTVGIVDGVEGNEASLLPSTVIRSAAQRVIARQSSVPRPWLGVRGEAVAEMPLDQIVRNRWTRENAMFLLEDPHGILLTSIVPGSPAALASLQPGDVILRVNEGEVKSANDFSLLLDQAADRKPLQFTIVRRDHVDPEAVQVMLTESMDPFFANKMFELQRPRATASDPLRDEGIETVAIRPKSPVRAGASGLLVVFVQPQTQAFKAGLRTGDLIEAINGQTISATTTPPKVQPAGYTLKVRRNKETFVFTVLPQK